MKPGDQIGEWVIEKTLGKGGMGTVFLCHHREDERDKAALKIFPAWSTDEDGFRRFERECEVLSRLDHPGIVPLKSRHATSQRDPGASVYWIAMAFIDGPSLEARLDQGPLPPGYAAACFHQIADALAYSHQRGVYHRDIKPANLVLGADGARLVDFGIALQKERTRLTALGTFAGTLAYMPPEVVVDERVSPDPVLGDMYAVGVVLYEALTAERAFATEAGLSDRARQMRILKAKMACEILDPGEGIPMPLREAVRQATNPDPELRLKRWASFQALMEQVPFEPDLPLEERPEGQSQDEPSPTSGSGFRRRSPRPSRLSRPGRRVPAPSYHTDHAAQRPSLAAAPEPPPPPPAPTARPALAPPKSRPAPALNWNDLDDSGYTPMEDLGAARVPVEVEVVDDHTEETSPDRDPFVAGLAPIDDEPESEPAAALPPGMFAALPTSPPASPPASPRASPAASPTASPAASPPAPRAAPPPTKPAPAAPAPAAPVSERFAQRAAPPAAPRPQPAPPPPAPPPAPADADAEIEAYKQRRRLMGLLFLLFGVAGAAVVLIGLAVFRPFGLDEYRFAPELLLGADPSAAPAEADPELAQATLAEEVEQPFAWSDTGTRKAPLPWPKATAGKGGGTPGGRPVKEDPKEASRSEVIFRSVGGKQADVYINGKRRGSTPLQLHLKPGEYKLKFAGGDGDKEMWVEIKAFGVVEYTFDPGTLKITSSL